jgi:hypothetical protein
LQADSKESKQRSSVILSKFEWCWMVWMSSMTSEPLHLVSAPRCPVSWQNKTKIFCLELLSLLLGTEQWQDCTGIVLFFC